MGTITTITGEVIEVCPQPSPGQPTRPPRHAIFVGSVRRGWNIYGDALIDRYYVSHRDRKAFWVLWVSYTDNEGDKRRTVRNAIKWCLAKNVPAKSAALALLQETWQEEDDGFHPWRGVSERAAVEEAGLLTSAEILAVLRVAVGKETEPRAASDPRRS